MSTPANPKHADNTADKARPGRKAGAPAKVWDYTGLDTALLGAPQPVTAQLASMAAPMRARDERQVLIDATVAEVHAEYVAAGKPSKWAQMPKRAYHVNPKAADTLRMMIRRAAAYHGLSVKFGSSVRDPSGREIVVFAPRDQRVKTARGDTFTLAELREFVTGFFGDDTESADDFMAAWQGEEADETDTEDDTIEGENSGADSAAVPES